MVTLLFSSFLLGLAFCAPPGVITAETIRRGLARGFGPALTVQFGSLVGDVTWALIALTGLSFLIQYTPAKTSLSILGMILLLKLALESFKNASKATQLNDAPASERGDFATGATLSLSNPFNIIFWSGIGTTAFASVPGEPQISHYIAFFLAFLCAAVLWCFLVAGLVAWGRKFITPTLFRGVNLACGATLTWFAIQVGWQTLQNLFL